jgi:hypothetical protein
MPRRPLIRDRRSNECIPDRRDRIGVGDHAVRDDQIPLAVVFDHACANE